MDQGGAFTVFADAVAGGHLSPADFDHLWIEAGSMSSSGSHSQLELPRRGNLFFGADFDDYDSKNVELILALTLTMGGNRWYGKKLTWHGDNKMERINLPTRAKGGGPYKNTAILFTRHAGEFEITVAPWNSNAAEFWRRASAEIGTLYQAGSYSARICGVF
jgi:hypothetical protein